MAKELEKLQAEKVMLVIGGREREIKFNFSVWAKLEDEMGGLDNLPKLEEQIEKFPFKTIPHLVWLGLKDKEDLTEETVLDDYSLADVEYISETILKALYNSLPEDEGKKAGKEA